MIPPALSGSKLSRVRSDSAVAGERRSRASLATRSSASMRTSAASSEELLQHLGQQARVEGRDQLLRQGLVGVLENRGLAGRGQRPETMLRSRSSVSRSHSTASAG